MYLVLPVVGAVIENWDELMFRAGMAPNIMLDQVQSFLLCDDEVITEPQSTQMVEVEHTRQHQAFMVTFPGNHLTELNERTLRVCTVVIKPNSSFFEQYKILIRFWLKTKRNPTDACWDHDPGQH